ncbi:MAG: o-pyrocatechuate decarboxylase [Chloroflexi bacterium]|nr:o-pyrocatechuate decarboxylase [Chloroflexota bacterium]
MEGKIALEEHFAISDTISATHDAKYTGWFPAWPDIKRRLLDLKELRLPEMDRHGIERVILGLHNPAVQGIADARQAAEVARKANDTVAEFVATHPHRFSGFAALPMQDPDMAIAELTRCIKDLGFKGTMVNGFSQVGTPENVVYLDDPRYEAFWGVLEQFDYPLYLHPRDPLLSREPVYEGHPWFMGSAWAFGVETAIHALRLMASGLFDRHPKLNVVLGHLGEGLPFMIWRIDHRISQTPRNIPAKRKMADYLGDNFYLTVSGNFRTPSLIDAMMEVGSDRIMFSVDYPFEKTAEAATWFDELHISERDRRKMGRTNALSLFKLEGSPTASR